MLSFRSERPYMLDIRMTGPFSDAFCGVFKVSKASYCAAKLAKCASLGEIALFLRYTALICLFERFRLCFGTPN